MSIQARKDGSGWETSAGARRDMVGMGDKRLGSTVGAGDERPGSKKHGGGG